MENQGKIIEYIDQGSFACALCLQDDGNRLHLLTLSNREVNLSPKRAVFASSSLISTRSSREELLGKLKEREDTRRRLQEKIQVKELWELVRDEEESFDYEYLAQLCFGETVTDDHVSALVRALFEDKFHFKMKDGRFFPHTEERVEQILRELEEETLREERLSLGSAWLKKAVEGKPVQDPPCKEYILQQIIDLAIYGKDVPNFDFGKELLIRAGINDIGEARKILIELGIWAEDENLDLIRFNIKTSFSELELEESARLGRLEMDGTGREDLRKMPVFTIDGPLTRDFDDAISVEVEGDCIHLGIHIADVASLIPVDSVLDKVASQRGSSVYLPCLQIPMLPPNLSQDTLCLKLGCDRPAISMLSRLDKGGNLLDFRFVPSLIRVEKQLTYDQVNETYMEDGLLREMYRLSELLRQKRNDRGALVLSLPEIAIQINPDSSISLQMIEQETPSRMMVAELMILYNRMVARFCADNRIPLLYRAQEEPSEKLSIDDAGYYYYVFKQRRKLNPLVIDTEAKPHAGLGVDAYTNASSPIRRYFDLIVQRQIRNFLLKEAPVYNEEGLEKMRMGLGVVLKDLERMKRNRTRYWIQKFLLQHTGEKFRAIVLDSMKNRYRILLTDLQLVVEMKRQEGQDFSGGQGIIVKIKKSDPWNDLLKVEYAGAG
ncbi:MAG: ribonuclease catalytic domain-containing protein [Desulfobacterales bacterium]|nr:ribonuclease catalytic domain-containing protein [Desulfobacterales bacterium]